MRGFLERIRSALRLGKTGVVAEAGRSPPLRPDRRAPDFIRGMPGPIIVSGGVRLPFLIARRHGMMPAWIALQK